MRFLQSLVVFTCIWGNSDALPLNEAPKIEKALARRAKTYSIVNVEGEATQPPKTVVETVAIPVPVETQTIRVTDVAPPIVPITAVPTSIPQKSPTPSPASAVTTSSLISSTSSSITASAESTTSPTTTPTIVPSSTVTPAATTAEASSTKYYDDGMWHTRYPIKNFEPASLNATSISTFWTGSSSSSSTASPVLIPTSTPSYNQTYSVGRMRVRSRLNLS